MILMFWRMRAWRRDQKQRRSLFNIVRYLGAFYLPLTLAQNPLRHADLKRACGDGNGSSFGAILSVFYPSLTNF
ncbi:hypothetical protein KCP75_09170 [Salmonella enterica subsp. enterica]|nr:hypothetical protein KCP75_09170 [Salmonella enterica subsp. enterica]